MSNVKGTQLKTYKIKIVLTVHIKKKSQYFGETREKTDFKYYSI